MPETSDPKTSEKVKQVRPAFETIGRLRHGQVLTELSEELNLVTENVLKTRKKGSLTLTLNIMPVENTPNGVVIKAEVVGKPPELAKATDVFFADDDANLFTFNPKQRDMFERPRPVESTRNPPPADSNFDPSTGAIG